MKLRIGLIGLGDDWQTRHRPALQILHERFDVRAVYTAVSKLGETCQGISGRLNGWLPSNGQSP